MRPRWFIDGAMKRSHQITLVLLGAAGLAAYGLSNTGSAETEAEIFRNAEECIASGTDAEECRRARQAALEANDANAPRFAARSDCEADFGAGNCQPAAAPTAPATQAPGPTAATQPAAPAQQTQQAGVGSYFIPAMLGYAMARSMSGGMGGRAAQPLYGCAPGGGPGCFKTAQGTPVAAARSPLGGRSAPIARMPAAGFQRTASPTIVPRGSTLSQTVSRGGFGTTGRSMSSFGAGG